MFNSLRPSDAICVGNLTIIGSYNGLSPGGRSIATGLRRKPVGGCYGAEMRRPAIRSTAHDLILSYPIPVLSYPILSIYIYRMAK